MALFVVGEGGSIRNLHFATWEVRLTVLIQLRHCKQRSMGIWTVEPQASMEDTMEEVDGLMGALSYGQRIQT